MLLACVPGASLPGLNRPFELSQPNLVVIIMIKCQDNINKTAEEDELKISMKVPSISNEALVGYVKDKKKRKGCTGGWPRPDTSS